MPMDNGRREAGERRETRKLDGEREEEREDTEGDRDPQPPGTDEHTPVMENRAEAEMERGGGRSRQKTGRQK